MENSFENPDNKVLLERSATDLRFLSDTEIQGIPNFRRMTEYLKSVSKEGQFPDRRDVNPMHLRELLPDLYILDVVRENNSVSDFILRLMGTNVANFYGEHTGESIQAMANKEAVRRIEICATMALEEKRNIAVTVGALSSDAKHLRVSVLYCPLAKEDQIINQIIGLAVVRSGSV